MTDRETGIQTQIETGRETDEERDREKEIMPPNEYCFHWLEFAVYMTGVH